MEEKEMNIEKEEKKFNWKKLLMIVGGVIGGLGLLITGGIVGKHLTVETETAESGIMPEETNTEESEKESVDAE